MKLIDLTRSRSVTDVGTQLEQLELYSLCKLGDSVTWPSLMFANREDVGDNLMCCWKAGLSC